MGVTYNGYEFSEYASFTIVQENVYDPAYLAVVGHKIKLTVKDFALKGSNLPGEDPVCPANMEAFVTGLKSLLMECRKPLTISGIGFGEVDLSVASHEINHGPHPMSFEWAPIGANQAAAITWVVEFTLSPCLETHIGVSGFVLTSSHSINEKGYSTFNWSGFVEVAAVTTEGADAYRSFITIAHTPNCHRTQNWNISEDNRRLSFSISDQEIESPNAYPMGVVSISAPSTLTCRLPSLSLDPNVGKTSARVQISCNMELRGNESRLRAWTIWNSILAARLGRVAVASNDYIVRDMTVTEDWFTNHYSFSCVVTHYNQNLIMHLTMFSFFALVNNDWALWSTSMQNANRARGLSNASLDRPLAKISLCDNPNQVVTLTDHEPPVPPLDVLLTLCNPTPTPEKSWLEFQAELIEAPAIESVTYTTYGESTIAQNAFNPSSPSSKKPAFDFQPSGTGYTVKHINAPSVQRYIWRGTAKRIGFPIPPPTMVTVNGVTMKLAGTPRVVNDLVGYQYCQPIFEATWSIGLIYDQDSSPAEREETDPSGLKGDGEWSPPP